LSPPDSQAEAMALLRAAAALVRPR